MASEIADTWEAMRRALERDTVRLAAAEKLAKAVEEVLEAESPYDRLRELRAALKHWREVQR